jgi:hypothetical protein
MPHRYPLTNGRTSPWQRPMTRVRPAAGRRQGHRRSGQPDPRPPPGVHRDQRSGRRALPAPGHRGEPAGSAGLSPRQAEPESLVRSTRSQECFAPIELASPQRAVLESMAAILAESEHVCEVVRTVDVIRRTAAVNDNPGSSSRAWATRSCARSRSSSGYFLGAGTMIILREIRVSTEAGAVQSGSTT